MTEGTRAADYTPGMVRLVRSTCLYVAIKLQDLLEDVVIVGGMVPQLLVDPQNLALGASLHVGTRDLDLGLSLILLEGKEYEGLRDRLREAGFHPDKNEKGNETRQRWVFDDVEGVRVTIDFLIPRTGIMGDQTLQNLTLDLAAIRTEGLELAFEDRVWVELSGQTVRGAMVKRPIAVPVCGPASYLVLKTRAFRNRGKDMDAYDLCWLVQHYPGGVDGIVEAIQMHRSHPDVIEALGIIEERFIDADGLAAVSVATFLHGRSDPEVQATVAGVMLALLERVREV